MVLGPNASTGSWGYTIGNQSTVIARLIKEVRPYLTLTGVPDGRCGNTASHRFSPGLSPSGSRMRRSNRTYNAW